jgi:hypothetical protein
MSVKPCDNYTMIMVNYVDIWLVHSHVASLLDGAEFLRFISLTLALSHRSLLVLCRCWTKSWMTSGSWILIAHDT